MGASIRYINGHCYQALPWMPQQQSTFTTWLIYGCYQVDHQLTYIGFNTAGDSFAKRCDLRVGSCCCLTSLCIRTVSDSLHFARFALGCMAAESESAAFSRPMLAKTCLLCCMRCKRACSNSVSAKGSTWLQAPALCLRLAILS